MTLKGDFLKELELTESRSTGIPKIRTAMTDNGSPEPEFHTDDDRTHFLTVLPANMEAYEDETDENTIDDTDKNEWVNERVNES